MGRYKKITWILAGLAVLALVVWAFIPNPVHVEMVLVAEGSFEQTVEEEGKTNVREKYTISSPLSGTLRRVLLKAGDPVEAGTFLASISSSLSPFHDVRETMELRERLGAAEGAKDRSAAALEEARIALAHARKELDRLRQLFGQGFVSRTDLDQGELQFNLKTNLFQLTFEKLSILT